MLPVSPREREALWRQIGRQSVWGKRGLAKTGTLWLPLATVLALGPAVDPQGAWLAGAALFVASACRTLGTVLANDLADRADDAAAAKRRWVRRLSPPAAVSVAAALLGAGALVLFAFGAPPAALAAYAVATALGLAYSLPPFRLKERGLLGLVGYSLCCACAYAALPWAWVGSGWPVLAILVAVVFSDRWVNLHFHQVLDCEADRARGCRTYAVRAGPDAARRTLRLAAGIAALAMLALMGFLAAALWPAGGAAVGLAGAVALAAALYASVARRRPGASSALVRALPPAYLGLTYGGFWVLPLPLLALFALREPAGWVLAAAAALSALLATANTLRYRYD